MSYKPHGIVLFSGGLDSILVAKLLEAQGLRICCVHFTSPFFGKPNPERWRKLYGLDVQAHDISREMIRILLQGPAHGFGKTLNPCVDCKILLLGAARKLLEKSGAQFIATGEVLGQRPMSQRRDSLDLIRKRAEVDDLLIRPLCAKLYPPTKFESSGLIDRDGLYGISGRSRNQQLELANKFGLSEIPSPAGGCLLTEIENGRRYWQLIKKWRAKTEEPDWNSCMADFNLARLGRQFWRRHTPESIWLIIGRQKDDNAQLLAAAAHDDLTLKLADVPGPIALCRNGANWPEPIVREAASLLCAHSPRICGSDNPVRVSVFGGGKRFFLFSRPERHEGHWGLQNWNECRQEIKEARAVLQ